jgi:hypothetical protein
MGNILRLVRREAIHRRARFPSGQAVASSGRLGPCRTEAGGTRLGPAGATIGTAHRTWAVSAAAVWCWRNHPHGQQLLARLAKPHHPGQALTMLAHTLARAVSSRRNRTTAVDLALVRRTYGSGAGAPDASLDTPRDAPAGSVLQASCTASWNATVRRGPVSLRLTR